MKVERRLLTERHRRVIIEQDDPGTASDPNGNARRRRSRSGWHVARPTKHGTYSSLGNCLTTVLMDEPHSLSGKPDTTHTSVFAAASLVVQHDQVQRRPEQSSPIGVIHSVTLDDISYSAPALASWQGRIFLAWTGGDGRICVQTSADGHHFSEPVSLVYESYGPRPADRHTRKSRLGSRAPFPLPGDLALRRSPTFPWAPALAATEYGVDMGWRDPDRRIRILRASPDGEPREIILPETSAVAPSIAGLGRNLSLAWTGWDGHINVAGSHDESFHPKVRLEHTSADSPALCSVDGGLALAWTGTDRHINIDVTGSGSFSHPQRLEETSNEGPAIGALGRRIALAWTGADDHVNIAVMHDRTSRSEGVRLDWTTFYSPAITAHGGHFVLAWTAPDGRISLAALQI